jgi:Restriction endonuclease
MKTTSSNPSAKAKGTALEDAVRAIEDTILRSSPGLSEGTFRFQSNRIVKIGGVRHEIDIFVTAALPSGYESTFIFECKNWQAKVGKNEIIVFAEKIASLGAQRGFFVASSFTKDARAQAAKDIRIQLLTASFVKPVTAVQFPQLVQTHIGATTAHVQFGIPNFSSTPLASLPDLGKQTIRVGTETTVAKDYIDRWIDSVRRIEVNRMDLSEKEDGEYTIQFSAEAQFPDGEASIDDFTLRQISVSGTAQVAIVRAQVLSIFDVETRGRFLQVGMDHGGIAIRADIVELHEGR